MNHRAVHRAPVEAKVAASDVAARFNQRFHEALETLSPGEAQTIRRMLNGASLRRIAADEGIPFFEAQKHYWAGLSKLRHPARGHLIHISGLDDDDLSHVLQLLHRSAEADAEALLWCDHHGWTEPLGMPRCPECTCELPPPITFRGVEQGRPRAYCSASCRQRAYRRRIAKKSL